MLKKSDPSCFARVFGTLILGSLPFLNLAPSLAMEKEANYVGRFLVRSSASETDDLKINAKSLHQFLTELPKKLKEDSDAGIIHNLTVAKNETSQMPSYNDFLYCDGNEYYGISFIEAKTHQAPDISKLLSTDFSLFNLSNEQQQVKMELIESSQDSLLKSYTAYFVISHDFEITYCHLFYLSHPTNGQGSGDFHQKVNPVRQKSMYDFFTSAQLTFQVPLHTPVSVSSLPKGNQEVSPRIEVTPAKTNQALTGLDTLSTVRAKSSPISISMNMLSARSNDDAQSTFESPQSKLPPTKGSISQQIMRKFSNPPKFEGHKDQPPKKPSSLPLIIPNIPHLETAPRDSKGGNLSPKNSSGSSGSKESPTGNDLSPKGGLKGSQKGSKGGKK